MVFFNLRFILEFVLNLFLIINFFWSLESLYQNLHLKETHQACYLSCTFHSFGFIIKGSRSNRDGNTAESPGILNSVPCVLLPIELLFDCIVNWGAFIEILFSLFEIVILLCLFLRASVSSGLLILKW